MRLRGLGYAAAGALAAGLLAGCAAPPGPAPSQTLAATETVPATAAATPGTPEAAACSPAPIVAPTLPAEIPGYTQLDPSTGLHITGTYQLIDPVTYRLKVAGSVERPLSLSLDALRCMPRVEARPTLICPGAFTDTATWAGVPLRAVLDQAGLQAGASEIDLIAADGYEITLPLADVIGEDNFLAYEWEGQPLPILHGFPLRAVFPDLDGNNWVKWLVEIDVH